MSLRASRLQNGALWRTSSGGTFFEPVQRPSLTSARVDLVVSLTRSDYKLLEVLYDDVASYAGELLAAHVRGLRKSAQYNAERKQK